MESISALFTKCKMYSHHDHPSTLPSRHTKAESTSPVRINADSCSPVKSVNDRMCLSEDNCPLLDAYAPDFSPHRLYFEDNVSTACYELKTPCRYDNRKMAIPLSVADAMVGNGTYHRRTSPTSVVEFERTHAPTPPGARDLKKRPTALMHQYDPAVSRPMAQGKSIHQGILHAATRYDDHMSSYCKSDCDGNHPTPQNLRDNPERQAKIKTELCQFWIDKKPCPWGVNCNFAHGEHDLKFRYSTLLLMEESGQISNAYTYLCRPCLTFVSTGACPFGRRCTCIHDPRVQGPIEYPSWLPMATSKTNAQIIVDPIATLRESSIHQENPLVSQSIWQHCRPSLKEGTRDVEGGKDIDFEDTYKIVCNIGVPVFSGNIEKRPGKNLSGKLTELQKLCIVERFRASHDKNFLYSPTHSLRGELCMILQTRYFCLKNLPDENMRKDGVVEEISCDEYRARTTPWSQAGVPYSSMKVVRGHEVVFAPKGESTCNYSVWFDEEPVWLEQTQIKKCRRIKQKNKTNIKKGHTRPNANGELIVRTSPVDFRSGGPPIDPFVYMIPAEDNVEGNRLIDSIIEHRIDSIILGLDVPDEKQDQSLIKRKMQLQRSFEILDSFHKKWLWPVRDGLDNISFSTQAPPENSITYLPKKADQGNEEIFNISNLWQGFVENVHENNDQVIECKKRLPIFHSISRRNEGHPIPRLSNFNHDGANDTWKQLLLGQSGEWSTARELYEKKTRGSAPARNLPLSTIPFVQN